MTNLKKDAIKALHGLGWTRQNIQDAFEIRRSDVQDVLGKSTRGRKTAVKAVKPSATKVKAKAKSKVKSKAKARA